MLKHYLEKLQQPQTEHDRIRELSYKLDMLLSGIGYDVAERDREQIFGKQSYLEEIKSKIDVALEAGVKVDNIGRVSCLNSLLEGCRTLPEMYRNSITAELTAYIIGKGADVISSGCIYNDMPPLKLATMYGYDESVTSLIKNAIQKQTSRQCASEESALEK
ncbi:MAG: hypothetical protein IJX26_04645 [Clostridia bacterium]|nr:hypothetical protein [Clostridia bacterium]